MNLDTRATCVTYQKVVTYNECNNHLSTLVPLYYFIDRHFSVSFSNFLWTGNDLHPSDPCSCVCFYCVLLGAMLLKTMQ